MKTLKLPITNGTFLASDVTVSGTNDSTTHNVYVAFTQADSGYVAIQYKVSGSNNWQPMGKVDLTDTEVATFKVSGIITDWRFVVAGASGTGSIEVTDSEKLEDIHPLSFYGETGGMSPDEIGGAVARASKGVNKRRIVLLGDSITRQNINITGSTIQTLNIGYFTQANAMLGDYFDVVNYAGVSGETAQEISDRFASDVIPFAPDYVVVLAGTNDLISGSSPVAVSAVIFDLWDRCKNIGADVICATIPPSSSLSSEDDWHELNYLIREEALSRGLILADFAECLIDSTVTTWPYVDPSVFYDGLHPSHIGAYLMGVELSSVLSGLSGVIRDIPAADGGSLQKNQNLRNSGSGGAVVSGVAPDGFETFISSLPVGSTLTGSIVTEGLRRRYRVDLTGSDGFQSFHRPTCSAPSAGKSYYAIAEIKASLVNCQYVNLQLRTLGGSDPKTSTSNKRFADNAVVSQYDIDGVLKTPLITNDDGSSSLIVDVFVFAESGYVEIGRIAVVEV